MAITKISIDNYSVEIPKHDGTIEEPFIAMLLAFELAGWHKKTIEEHVIEYAEQLKENKDGK
jgi:hypothetical protein